MQKEKFWSQYAENFGELNTYVVGKTTIDSVVKEVSKLKKLGQVLELACGDGFYTRVLSQNSKHITATDYSKEMVAAAKAKLSELNNIEFMQANAMALEFENASFDTVFMANLLHIVPDYEPIVESAYRVLKPNGRIIALDFTMDGMTEDEQKKLIERFIKTYGIPQQTAKKGVFSVADMSTLFQSKGFKVSSSDLIGVNCKAVLAVGIKSQ